MPAEDLIGKRFGRCVIQEKAESRSCPSGHRETCVLVKCDCDETKVVRLYLLRSGKTRSCGCLSKETTAARSVSHGHRKNNATSGEYQSWRGMIKRCEEPNHISYPRYGGRGIIVCQRWRNGEHEQSAFECFLADMGERPTGMTLDRYPDADGNYEPGNCRWATDAEQHTTMSRALVITTENETLTLKESCRRGGISYHAVFRRVKAGLTPAEALASVHKNPDGRRARST